MIKLILGDCLKELKKMNDNSIDVTFTSPPYNDTGNANTKLGGGTNTLHKKYLTVETRKDWYEWQLSIIDECLRVSKKYVLWNVQGLKNNRKDLYKIIGHYYDKIHDIVIWYKPNGMPTSTKHKLSNTYEMLIILKCKGVKGVDVTSDFYRNVIVKNTNSNKEFKNIHRAVMNKDFCSEIIHEFTKEGDIVLDPFNGVGTTGVCCKEQRRDYIGIEIFETYYNESLKRINNTKCLVDEFDDLD